MASNKATPEASQSAEALFTKATTAEHARDFDTAFKAYISAAQAFLQRARNTPAKRTDQVSDAKAMVETCLARAELIKSARKDSLKPLSIDPFTRGASMHKVIPFMQLG